MNEDEHNILGVFNGMLNGLMISIPLWALIVCAIIAFC